MSEEKKQKSDEIKEFGALMLNENKKNYKIRLLTIIGEIEGHETVSNNTKATKYEHLLPQLAEAEESDEVEGVLILLNTLGGDVEAGLAIAEMIASLGKPTVSLVLGGSHSIGGPLAVSADYSFIDRNHGCSSGSFKRYFYRCDTESEKYGTYTGQNCQVYCCAL